MFQSVLNVFLADICSVIYRKNTDSLELSDICSVITRKIAVYVTVSRRLTEQMSERWLKTQVSNELAE